MTQKMYLAPYVRYFFEDHLACRRNVSHNTIQSYRDSLKLFLKYAAERIGKSATRLLVSEIDEAVVIDFLRDLEQARGNKIQTRNHRLVALRCLCEYIASREPRLLDHCRKITTIPRKRGETIPEIHYLEKDQITAILGAVDKNTSLGFRDYTLLLFMYNSGARVQEVADAQTTWISLTKPYKVEILGKGRKLRTCPLWENTARHLKQLVEKCGSKANRHLFLNRLGRSFSRSGIANVVGRHAVRAAENLPSLRGINVTPHTLRHTTAMHLLQSGVEVNVIRSWLGHVSIATTNCYVEIDLAMKAKALEVCEVGFDEEAPASWKSDPDILTWLESL